MNIFTSRNIAIAVVFAVSLTTLYAHHGTQFLSKALEANTTEVQLAHMASTKSQNARIKDFAQMLVTDHNQAIDKIKALLDARLADSVRTRNQVDGSAAKAANADVQLTPEHRRTAERLGALSGADFDREFIDVMVGEHRIAIRDFEAQSHVHGNGAITSNKAKTDSAGAIARQKASDSDQKNYSSADLRRDLDTSDFAEATLATLKHHLEEAEAIQKELLKK
jgi:putative membrane protein